MNYQGVKNIVFNEDCMIAMAKYPDKYFDLAIVDPEYGIGAGGVKFINGTSKSDKSYYKKDDWDKQPASQEYFTELFRVSKNQIICGGNYFTDKIPVSRCWVVWDKTIHGNSYADCELLWTSFDEPARYFRENIAQTNSEGRIHPTQKSIKFYKYLLDRFARLGDKILDSHVGSGSSRIACYDYGFNFTGFELDGDYFEAQEKRFKNHTEQIRMFVP